MRINFLPSNSSYLKAMNNTRTKLSFGEADGDWGSDNIHRISKETYYARRDEINKRYDRMIDNWLEESDDTGMSSHLVWDEVKRLRAMQQAELNALERRYNQ